MSPLKELKGQKFSRLVVVGRAENSGKGEVRWICECDCGTVVTVFSNSLRYGMTKSCGCLNKETPMPDRTTHGHSKNRRLTPEYRSWRSMWSRCTNVNEDAYKNYGGRGITISDDWISFEHFFADMGPREGGNSLDRINNDGNYEASNCRWATRKEQNSNKRRVNK